VKDDGVIAVHVTNRYLDLHPVVHRLANELEGGWTTLFVEYIPPPEKRGELMEVNHWMLLSANQEFLNDPDVRAASLKLEGEPRVSLWTDDSSSLLEVMRWTQPQ